MLSRWVTRAGYALLGLGVVALTPVSELLPVDLLLLAEQWLHPGSARSYLRVVPAVPDDTAACALIALGLALVLIGHFLKRMGK